MDIIVQSTLSSGCLTPCLFTSPWRVLGSPSLFPTRQVALWRLRVGRQRVFTSVPPSCISRQEIKSMHFGGLKNGERVQGELVRESPAEKKKQKTLSFELRLHKQHEFEKLLSENISRSQTSGHVFVVEQFCMITVQISNKQEYLALCLQPWFVFLTLSMVLLELLHVWNERTKQSNLSGGGANTYLRVSCGISPLWHHSVADFPRVACFRRQEAVKDVSFSFLGEFSDFFV